MMYSFNRKLYSSAKRCPFGCKYCFAKWKCYEQQAVFTRFTSPDGCQILYPSCDGEGLLDYDFFTQLSAFTQKAPGQVLISISTKAKISDSTINRLSIINKELILKGKGFIKLATSISTESHIYEIEPGCASIDERLDVIHKAKCNGIPVAVTLKPILPFVKVDEYAALISRFSRVVDLFLLGGLYVSKDTEFYNKYIKDRYETVSRAVGWLDGEPIWSLVDSQNHVASIKKYIEGLGLKSFTSDLSLLNYLKCSGKSKRGLRDAASI